MSGSREQDLVWKNSRRLLSLWDLQQYLTFQMVFTEHFDQNRNFPKQRLFQDLVQIILPPWSLLRSPSSSLMKITVWTFHLAISHIPLGTELNSSIVNYLSTCVLSPWLSRNCFSVEHTSLIIFEKSTTDQVIKFTGLERCSYIVSITCVSIGLLQQVGAGMHVCKGADAQAIGGMQLRLQEVTAVLTNIHEL